MFNISSSHDIRENEECHCCGKITNVDFYSDYPFCRYLCFDCKADGGKRSSMVSGITYFHNNEFVSCCRIADGTQCNDCYFTCLPYSKKFANYPLGKVSVFFPKDDIPIDCFIINTLPDVVQGIIKDFSGEWINCSIDSKYYTKEMIERKVTKVRRVTDGNILEVPYKRVRNSYRNF